MKEYNLSFLILLLFMIIQTEAAEKLSGKVIDNSGNPIEGAMVKLQSVEQPVPSYVDGTFDFDIVAIHKYNSHTKNQIRIHNGNLFVQNTALQNVILDIFNLNGREICKLQNGKLRPGSYQFSIPDLVGKQILLLRTKIGSVNQVYKLIGNSNASLSIRQLDFSEAEKFASAAVDTIKVTHPQYDDVIVPISNYHDSVIVKMTHKKLSFADLNKIKIGDTLWNQSKLLMATLDSINDFRCCCSCFCGQPGAIKIQLTLHVKSMPHRLKFTLPGSMDTTVEGLKVVIDKINPTCPSSSGNKDHQDYSVSFGIVQVDTYHKVIFLNYTSTADWQFESENCAEIPCLPVRTFNFSEDKILTGSNIPEMNDSLKIIFGDNFSVKFNGEPEATRNSLSGIESFPWNNISDFTIDSVGLDDAVHMFFKNQRFSLKAGELKTISGERFDTTENCIVKVNTIDSLINYGVLYPWQIKRENQ